MCPRVIFADWCPSIRDHASTFTPELIEIDAQEWRRSCGVMSCTPALLTARVNHPVEDFERGK
jgi:hypothetical protein